MEATVTTAKEDPDKCFRRLVNLKSQLKALEVDIPDGVTVSRLQFNVPPNYKQLTAVLDCDATPTYEEFKQRVCTRWDRSIKGAKPDPEGAYAGFTGNC